MPSGYTTDAEHQIKAIVTNTDPNRTLKPCCVCKETKNRRDECIVLNGEESCGTFIEAHKECLRKHGFQI